MERPPRDLRGPLAASCVTASLLAGGLVWALTQRSTGPSPADLLADPEVRREVIAELVNANPGTYDSHPDPSVGRTMQPGLVDRRHQDTTYSTNAAGLREEPWTTPKPDGLVRVVVLGDSFVFGFGVAAEERLGVHLERLLVERAGLSPDAVECLHLGVPSWDLVAAATYLRRQLDALDPDLVVHVTVSNDLDDTAGVRGFGVLAQHAPRRPEQADVLLRSTTQRSVGATAPNLLNAGLDHESRRRFDEAASEVQRLREALVDRGARYLLVAHWGSLGAVFAHHLGSLGDDLVVLPNSFAEDASTFVAPSDYHWNVQGHARVAAAVYQVLASDARRTGTLAGTVLPEVEDADARALLEEGRLEAGATAGLGALEDYAARWPRSLAFPLEGELAEKSVHGGVDRDGLVGAYAALVLAPAERLRIALRFLPDRALEGARVRLVVDGEEEQVLEVIPGGTFDATFPLSRPCRAPLATVELYAEDFVYRGEDARRCVSLWLERVEFVD